MDPEGLEEKPYSDLLDMAKHLGLIYKGAAGFPSNPSPKKSSAHRRESKKISKHAPEADGEGGSENVDPRSTLPIPDRPRSTRSVKPGKTPRVASTAKAALTPLQTPSSRPVLKARPTPNFARIHEKAFRKMESIDGYVARRQKEAAKLVSRIPRRVESKTTKKGLSPKSQSKIKRTRGAELPAALVASGVRQRNRMVLGKVRSNRRFDLLLSHRGIDM